MATIPSSGKDRDWVACLRRNMSSAWWGNDVSGIDDPPDVLNGEYLTAVNAAGTGTIPLIGSDGDRIVVAGQALSPSYKTVVYRSLPVGTASGRRFWISDGNYTVVGVQEIHSVVEATAAAMGAAIQKQPIGGVAQSLMSATLNMKSAANTVQNGALLTVPGVLNLQTGDHLVWTTNVAGTELAGVVLEVMLAPSGRNNQTNVYFAGAGAVDSCFFIANRPLTITRIDLSYGTPSSGACTMQITLDTGTVAPGAGTDLLTGTGFDCALTASVVQTGTFAGATRMNPGDRLSMDVTGTTTGLTGGCLTVTFAPTEDRKDLVFYGQANATHADAFFFIADRTYEVLAASAVWSTPATAGANCQLTVDSGVQAAGAGLDLLSNDTNAGFQIDGAANTVEFGTFISPARNFLLPGDRLSLDFTVTTTIVNMVCVVTLKNA